MPGMFGGGGMSGQDMLNLANQEAALNRTNTYSPIYGGTTWSRTPGTQGGTTNVGPQPGWTHDPTSGMPIEFMSKDWTTPMSSGGGGGDGSMAGQTADWTQTQTLSPFMQQKFDLAQQLQGRVAGEMKPLDTSGMPDLSMDPNFEQNQADQAFAYSKGYLDPQWAMQQKQMAGQLAAQGLHPGDPGYNQAMQQFNTGRTQAYDQARTGSYQTGVQAGATRMNTAVQSTQAQIAKQLQESGWSLGQVNALMAGLPAAPGGQASNTSLLNAQLQNSLAQQQMQAQAANNMVGAGATIVGAAISDVNAKENFSDPAPAIEEFLEAATPSEYDYRAGIRRLVGEGRQRQPDGSEPRAFRNWPVDGGGVLRLARWWTTANPLGPCSARSRILIKNSTR